MTTSLEYAVERIASEWEAAWNTHDMSRMAKLLTVDADFVNVLGKHWKGVTEIERAHASMHKTQRSGSVRLYSISRKISGHTAG